MENTNEQLLIDRLDNLLTGEALERADALLASDREAKETFACLTLAKDAIRYSAIHDRVAAIGKDFAVNSEEEKNAGGGKVRSLYRSALRVAAILVLVVGAATMYKYITVTDEKVFAEGYTGYELSTTRGEATADPIVTAYQNKDWNAVIEAFSKAAVKTNRSRFLAGMAHLEKKQYSEAIAEFLAVQETNRKTGDNFFQDESEYYLAMAYLGNHETAKAIGLLDGIRRDSNHLYHAAATRIPSSDIKFLNMKK